MWKSTSRGVSAKLRVASHRNVLQTCRIATEGTKQQTPPPQGEKSLKDVPKPGEIPPPAEPVMAPQGGGPRRRGGVFGKLVGLTLVGTAGAIGYAWYNQEFRNTVQRTLPMSKGVFDAVFTYLPDSPSVPAPILDEKRPRKKANTIISDPDSVKEEGMYKRRQPTEAAPAPATAPPPPSTDKATPAPAADKPAPKAVPKPSTPAPTPAEAESAAQRKAREKIEAERRQHERELEIAAENAALEVILESLVENCGSTVSKALVVNDKLIETTRTHTDLLKSAMDDSASVLNKEEQWQSVSMAFEAREDAIRVAETAVLEAKENLEKLRQAIDDGRGKDETKKNKMLISSKESLNKLSAELNKRLGQVAKVESDARVMLKYKDLVDQGRKEFQKELESIMPDVKIGKGRKLSEEELNVLIAHAHRRIDQLRKQLAEQVAMEAKRLEGALQDKEKEDEQLSDIRVSQERQKMLDEFTVEKDKWEADAQVQFEIELRHQLARQTAAHSEHLQEVLKVQEERLNKQFEREIHVRMMQERRQFDDEISGWIARLKGIEAAVEGRAESEKVARQAQELWLACVALNGAIRVGNEAGETWEEQLCPLTKQVDDIFFAAKNNPFVNLVLESIPEKALTRGVYTEDNLKERFWKVRRVAKRVALIDETGGSLFKFLLSYVQSFFIFNSVFAKDEGDSVNIEDLDTFQILSHAKYWLEKGDLEQALRFMNQLHGESRRVAADWIEEARLLLETRQAAYTLMAFASATGLGTIF